MFPNLIIIFYLFPLFYLILFFFSGKNKTFAEYKNESYQNLKN